MHFCLQAIFDSQLWVTLFFPPAGGVICKIKQYAIYNFCSSLVGWIGESELLLGVNEGIQNLCNFPPPCVQATEEKHGGKKTWTSPCLTFV